MKDMIGNEIALNDVVVYPGGNARYGGLKLMVGIVVKMTPKRISLITKELVPSEKAFKTVAKTSVKVLKCEDSAILKSPTVLELRLRPDLD